MKKVSGFTKRMIAILLSSLLVVGMIPVTALASEVQENTVQEEEAITTYAVTLDANGGYFVNEWDDVLGEYIESTEILNKQIPVGGTVMSFPVKEQENVVVTFMGWSLERDGELVSQGYEEYAPEGNNILYAVWKNEDNSVDQEDIGQEEQQESDTEDIIQDDIEIPIEESDNEIEYKPDKNIPDKNIEEGKMNVATPSNVEEISDVESVRYDASKSGKNTIVFAGGDGSEENPYQVKNADQLDQIRYCPDKSFIQTANIDLGGRNWDPILNEEPQDGWGGYNGNGYTISNLTISNCQSDVVGLFGRAGYVENVKMLNVNISVIVNDNSYDYVSIGAIAGYAQLKNCAAEGNISVTIESTSETIVSVGGLCGDSPSVETSHSDVEIECVNNGKNTCNIGGIAGGSLYGYIYGSYNNGAIIASGSGRIVCAGIVSGSYVETTISNCINYEDITVSSNNSNNIIAGITCGTSDEDEESEIDNCVNFGNIIDATFSSKASGIAYTDSPIPCSIHDCYNLGNISGNSDSGRITCISCDSSAVILSNNYAHKFSRVNGDVPINHVGTQLPNGENLSAVDIKSAISKTLSICGSKWREVDEDTGIESNTIIYYKDGRNSIKLDYGLDDCITGISASYNPKLAYLLVGLATSAYQGEQPFTLLDKSGGGFRNGEFPDNPLAITESLRNLGFSTTDIIEENYYTDAFDPNYSEDSTAFTIATKVLSNGERVISIVVRGTYGGFGQDGKFHVDWTRWASDWRGNTNFKNYNRGLHEGFSEAADEIINRLDQFLTVKAIGKADTKYVITGHSRGAAVANLVSKKLIDSGVSKNKVFDYNFACPDSGRDYDNEWNRNNKYSGIFNINNVKDIVGVIPGNIFNASLNFNTAITKVFSLDPEFGILFWGKYGTTYFFSDNWDTVADNAIGDPNVEHQPTYYLDYLKNIPSENNFKSWTEARTVLAANGVKEGFEKFGKLIGIFCPVDTEIIDSCGHKVAEIINGEQKYYNNSFGQVAIITAADQCLIYLSGNDDYSVNMKGTADGILDFFASDAIITDEEHTSTFENITLEQGMEINCAIDSEGETEETVLYVVDENGDPIEKILHDGNEGPVNFGGAESWDGDEYGFNKRELIWKYEENGTIRIRYEGLSTGETYSLQKADNYSWKEYNNSVLEIHVGKNISNLGKESLEGYPKLKRIFFEYDPPTFMTDNSASSPLIGKTLEIYYPADNVAWNSVVGNNYGGNITWEPYYSGVCGNELTWVLDSKGTLVISGSGVMYNWTDETKIPWNKHVTDIKAIVIKNGVRNIGPAAFKKCTNVSDVKIGNTVTDIGNYAFYECGLLKTIKIPSKITNIRDAAFAFCSNLNTITIPGSVSSIGKCSFEGCSNLKSVEICEGVSTIDKWAFRSCGNLLKVRVPESINNIGDEAFTNCSNDLVVYGIDKSYAEKYATEKELIFMDPSNVGYAVVSGITNQTYTGKALSQAVTVKIDGASLKEGTDYTVSYTNNINVGTATVTITGKGNYTGTVSKTFTIGGISIASATVTGVSNKTYTGSAQTQNPTVNVGDKTLTNGTDYKVSYTNNTNPGTATVTITGLGNYTGTKTATFTIKPVGWYKDGGEWYYYNNYGTKLTNGWAKDRIGWYWLGADGKITKSKWVKSGAYWYYLGANGVMTTGWQKVGGKWYYMNPSGAMTTGWQKVGGKWYYMKPSGVMTTGWQKVGGKWYYMNSSGVMTTGWQKSGGKWYYMNSSGVMTTGWQKIGGKRYYFNSSGVMATGWQKIGGKKYYFNSSGVWVK